MDRAIQWPDDRVVRFEIAVDITERKQFMENLKWQHQLERLINDLSIRFLDSETESFDTAVQASLEWIGAFIEADQGCVFFFSEDLTTVSDAYTWLAPEIDPKQDRLQDFQNLSLKRFPWMMTRLMTSEPICLAGIDALPPEADTEKTIMLDQGIKSAVIVPMAHNGKLRGLLGFNTISHTADWKKKDLRSLLQILGNVVMSALNRHKMESRLIKSEKLYRNLFESVNDLIYSQDLEGRFTTVNPAIIRTFGYNTDELIGRKASDFMKPELKPLFESEYLAKLKAEGHHEGVTCYLTKTGRKIYLEYRSVLINGEGDSEPQSINGISKDVTKRILAEKNIRKLEEEKERAKAWLRQVQKMEAIGTLAGGIAHDFNNMLFPLVGFAEMLKEDLPADSPLQNHVDEILQAALRSRDLVKQILAFSRQGDQDIKPVKLQPIVKEAIKLLRASIPTTIKIQHDIDPDCGIVVVDPTQMHQIVVNLGTNAYHAMEDTGGRLNVTLKQVRLESDQSLFSELAPGEYALLTVTDTGIGIEKDILDKIFDPYFTTKKTGKGTGLGLSVVQGIVKKCHGDIFVCSEPGKGTEIKVYLPIKSRKVENIQTDRNEPPIRGGNEKILLVDDEEAIARMEQQMFERLGYQVIVQTGSIEALEVFKANPDSFDLIVTDMTMPDMTGVQLIRKIKKIRPDIPVILCTGFSYQINDEKSKELGIDGFVMKPVVMKEIAETIRKVLDKPEEI